MMLYKFFNSINLMFYLFLFPFRFFSEGKDSTLLKRNLLSFEISKKIIMNYNLVDKKINLSYSINYERLFYFKKIRILYVGFGANLLYNHYDLKFSDAPPSFLRLNYKTIGTRLTTSLNSLQNINKNISYLFRVNPFIEHHFMVSYKSYYYINDTISYNSEGNFFSYSAKNIFRNHTYIIFGVITELGIVRKITNKISLLLNIGVNINNGGFEKISIVTRIFEPNIRIGIFL